MTNSTTARPAGAQPPPARAGPGRPVHRVPARPARPTLRYEGVLLGEMAGTSGTFGTVAADVLLMAGSKGLPFLRPGLDALAGTLPQSQRVTFPGLDHGGSSDPGPANRHGHPEVVAPEIRAFFTGP